jgi:hypothetical protein
MPARSLLQLSTALSGAVWLAACTGLVDGSSSAPGSAAGSGTNGTPGAGGSTSGGGGGPGPGLGSTPDEVAQACAATQGQLEVGLTKLRRLTRAQLDNTLAALLGITGNPSSTIAPDERMGPFHSNAQAPITDLIVQQYQELAAQIALDVSARMNEISPCNLAAGSGTTCAAEFVADFGMRAYRRPLAADEVAKLVELYTLAAQAGGAQKGFRRVVEAMLQSPFFLYHGETNEAQVPSAKPAPIDAFGLASRLSYFLWNSMPDDELFGLAQSGSLGDKSVIEAQVERMLGDPKAAPTLALFHQQWLGVSDLADKQKDALRYPEFDAALAGAMLNETARFAEYVIRKGDGLFGTLMTASFGFPEGGLFGLYHVTEPAGYVPGTPVMLNPDQRAGLLTQAAFLARHAHGDQTSPVHRGIVIRENFMCQTIQPPPANVNASPPPPTEATTTRQRFEQHQEDPACKGCHALIDGIGLGFEHYDAIGAYRELDGVNPVDATGEIVAAGDDLLGTFDGAVELAHKLAESDEVRGCASRQWFRFALGRVESASDACSIHGLQQAFESSGGDIRKLLAEIALSDAFRYVRGTAQEDQ